MMRSALVALVMDVESTFETSVNFYDTTQHKILENSLFFFHPDLTT
jgi:hypothetical protein